jgi:hypothetical protein
LGALSARSHRAVLDDLWRLMLEWSLSQSIRGVCREFVALCRSLNLFSEAIVAIDGSKFTAVNNRDKNLTDQKLKARARRKSGL